MAEPALSSRMRAGVNELSGLRDVAAASLSQEEEELAVAVKKAAREEALLTEHNVVPEHAPAGEPGRRAGEPQHG